MDALSHLLTLYPVRIAFDYRCRLAAPWRLDEPAVDAGVATYHLIVEGDAWLDVGKEKGIRLVSGDIVLLPRGNAHRLRSGSVGKTGSVRPASDAGPVMKIVNDESGPVTDILCGRFTADAGAALALLEAMPQRILIRSAERPEYAPMRYLIAMLDAETRSGEPGASVVAAHLASALFSLIVRAWLEQDSDIPGVFALLADPRLQNALQAMLAEPGRAWTLEELAASCHMSRATFARLFRHRSGMTPGDVLTRTRMAKAAHWLRQDARAVAAVAEAAGYQSEAAFSRAFKRCFGMGPGQYRRLQRKGASAG